MTPEVIVRVFDIIGGPLCVSTCDGQRLYDKIAPLLRTGTPVVLSFEQIEILIAAFLDAAVGQLYGELPDESIHALLSFRDLADDDREMLDHVIENAKLYFKTPDDFDRVWREELGVEKE
ncbi:MAG: STAS-like domain-containing protein [Gemmatimonadota bacterium]|nr:STAS-like domain-containing protein [Gemmatimonadota bacterium]